MNWFVYFSFDKIVVFVVMKVWNFDLTLMKLTQKFQYKWNIHLVKYTRE